MVRDLRSLRQEEGKRVKGREETVSGERWKWLDSSLGKRITLSLVFSGGGVDDTVRVSRYDRTTRYNR